LGIFLSGIEFLASVNVLAASVATHTVGSHETDGLLTIALFASATGDFVWIKVRGVVFAQNLSFGHGELEE
jgi:hypothetical protein